MKKKLLSLFMACAMILALAVPAFAEDYSANEEANESEDLTQTVTIATRTFVPTVRLTLPTLTAPSVVLNPYKISFTGDEALVNGQQVAAPNSGTNPDQVKQVISPVYFIKNQTNVKLNYTVAVTGSLEGDVTFSQEPVGLSETKKKAHIALMVANKGIVPSGTATDPSQSTTTEQKITNVNGLTAADIETQWLKNSEVKFTAPKSLDAITSSSGANFVAFQFKGDLTRQPTPNSWKAEDKVGAVITFTFTPESAQDYANTTAVALTYTQTASNGAAADLAVTTDKTDWAGIMSAASITAADVNATPEWKVENEGLYGAKLFTPNNATSPSGITFAAAKLDAVTAAAGGTAYNDTVILSFKDADGIPRTVALKVTITVSPAS